MLKNNLNHSTIHYLLTGVTKRYVSPEIALKIVCGINRGKTIGFVLRETKGALGDFLREKYASLINTEIEGNYPADIERTLFTKNARLVMMLAHNKGGTTREEILEILDAFALETLDKMLAENVLHEDKNGRITGKSTDIYINNALTKELIRELTYFSKEESSFGQIKVLWGKLSKKKQKIQKELTIEFIKKLRELYKDEDITGDPSFIAITADLLAQPNREGKEV